MIAERAEANWNEVTDLLRAFVSRRVGVSDADDVLQDALLRIQKGVRRLRDDERFGPWVYQVTRSAIADHFRAKLRPVAEVQTVDAVDDDDPPDVAEELRPALLGCLSSFVAELPSPYREAIALTELEGLSHREAAEMLGISLSGMKSRVQRGREHLRRTFERCCDLTLDARGQVIECEPRQGCSSPKCGVPSQPAGKTTD
jgi:RNA polymerase sigma-70 factor (ECF subfamily)